MSEIEPQTIMNHVSVGTNDLAAAGMFYDQIMHALGAKRVFEESFAIAYGKKWPEFWVQLPFDNQPASSGNGCHMAFMAQSREAVDAFHAAGIDAGGRCDGKPGLRDYTPGYYAAFLLDSDGNKLEAVHMPMGE